MYKIRGNEMVLCPYNRSHIVSKLRIQKHIAKCKTRYPELKLTTCFYNYTHRVRPEDILKHYEICSHKIRMEEAQYSESNQYIFSNSSVVNDEVVCDSAEKEGAPSFSKHKTNSMKNSVKSEDTKDLRFKTIAAQKNAPGSAFSENQSLSSIDNDIDRCDLKPLNLPKTVSKAFIGVKQQVQKSSNSFPASKSEFCQSRGISRGKLMAAGSTRQPQTNDHLLPDVSDMGNCLPKENESKKYFLFDDTITLKSDDIIFDDDNDGFIYKNFDKYMKI